jgi:hypothetical protein
VTDDQTCHWTGEQRAVGPKHPGSHDACEPCEARHYAQCGATHVPGDVLTCPRCIGRVRTALADIRALYEQLPDEALEHPNDPIPGGTPLVLAGPWSEGESGHLADEIGTPTPPLLVLATWEDAWRDILGAGEGSRCATVDSAADWLTAHLHEIAQHDAWPQFVTEIGQVRRQLEAVLRAGNRPVSGARCLSLDCDGTLLAHYRDPAPCSHDTEAKRRVRSYVRQNEAARQAWGYPLWLGYLAPVPHGTDRIRAALRAARRPCEQCDQGGRRDERKCSKCGRVYDEDDYHRANAHEASRYRPRTRTEIAQTLGVPLDRVKKWIKRGRLKPKRHTPRGVAEYDIREARRLAMRSDVA